MEALKDAYKATFIKKLNPVKNSENFAKLKQRVSTRAKATQEGDSPGRKKRGQRNQNQVNTLVVANAVANKEVKGAKKTFRQIFCGGLYKNPKKKEKEGKADSPRSQAESPLVRPSNPDQAETGFSNSATKRMLKETERKKKRKDEEEKFRYMWERNEEIKHTADYMTLLRKTASAVLANQGFVIREVFLNNGKDIGLVLTLPDETVKKVLLQMGASRVVEFGIADILSLEPIDRKYRPLRLNKHLQEEEWDRAYLQGKDLSEDGVHAMAELRQDIVSLLGTDCEMKHIVRLCGGVWAEENFGGEEQVIYDHEVIKIETWYLYRRFLVELAAQLKFIETNKKKLLTVVNLYYESVIIKGEDNRAIKKEKYQAKIDIHKFTVKEVVKAFSESHATVTSLVNSGEFHLDHEVFLDKKIKRTKVTNKLNNIWTYLEIQNKEYYHPYQVSNSKMPTFKMRFFHDSLWREYLMASNYDEIFLRPSHVAIEAFRKVERLKAASYLVGTFYLGPQSAEPVGVREVHRQSDDPLRRREEQAEHALASVLDHVAWQQAGAPAQPARALRSRLRVPLRAHQELERSLRRGLNSKE